MRVLIFVLMMGISILSSATTLNKIVVFGDSLSDNGNLYEYMKHQFPMSPPYYQGRMTNGPVWVELLAQSFFTRDLKSHLLDYAYAGAGVEEENDDEPLFTLRSEVESYLLSHPNGADENTLYVVWIGANNYLAQPDDVEQAVNLVNHGIKRALHRLIEKGATHFLILNLPDLGRTPVAREFDAAPLLTNLTNYHNAQLLQMIDSLKAQYPAVQWVHFDVKGSLDEMLANPEPYGFTDVTHACLDSDVAVRSSKQLSLMIADHNTLKGAPVSCENYLFFDLVHPSAFAHSILAQRSHAALLDAGFEFAN